MVSATALVVALSALGSAAAQGVNHQIVVGGAAGEFFLILRPGLLYPLAPLLSLEGSKRAQELRPRSYRARLHPVKHHCSSRRHRVVHLPGTSREGGGRELRRRGGGKLIMNARESVQWNA